MELQMNKKVKKILVVLAILLISIFPIIIRLYASDYDGIISKLKPGESSDNKINEIGAEILRIYTVYRNSIFTCCNNSCRYSSCNINYGR